MERRLGKRCLFEKKIVLLKRKLEEAKKKKQKWIQKVVKRAEEKGTKGAFREWCFEQGFTKVNKSCIEKAKKVARETGNTTLLRRAVAAENMLKAAGVLK